MLENLNESAEKMYEILTCCGRCGEAGGKAENGEKRTRIG